MQRTYTVRSGFSLECMVSWASVPVAFLRVCSEYEYTSLLIFKAFFLFFYIVIVTSTITASRPAYLLDRWNKPIPRYNQLYSTTRGMIPSAHLPSPHPFNLTAPINF